MGPLPLSVSDVEISRAGQLFINVRGGPVPVGDNEGAGMDTDFDVCHAGVASLCSTEKLWINRYAARKSI